MSTQFITTMTQGKYRHASPKESWVLEAVDYYTAFQYRGNRERVKVDNIPTLDEARGAAGALLVNYSSRPVIIYAVRGSSDAVVEIVEEP